MAKKKLKDKEAKAILLKWPTRTKKLWAPPRGTGYWVQSQPKSGKKAGPKLSAPGASLFNTQPDGMYLHFTDTTSCDAVVVEVCGTVQNLNDKRSRYFPANHSLVAKVSKDWLLEEVTVAKGGQKPRWEAAGSIKSAPTEDISVPIRHLRVLYALPNNVYNDWCSNHVPTGYEFFCPHSSLDSYNSQTMQKFLRQMSLASQFYTKPKGI